MKSLQAPNLKNVELTKAMYTAICSYDEQAIDTSEESEKKTLSVKKSLWPVPSQDVVEQAKNMAASDPSEVNQETP